MQDPARRVLIDYLASPQLDDVLLPEKNAEFFEKLSTVGHAFVRLGARRWANAYLDLPENDTDSSLLERGLKTLGPWRKGPFHIGDVHIDAEWRSDLKWDRFASFLPTLNGKRVLDVGASNGYHMYRLAKRGAQLALGVDPAHRAFFQFLAVQKYIPQLACMLLPTGWQILSTFKPVFDVVLCLGVIYHQPSPMEMLTMLYRTLVREGTLVVESLVVPGDAPTCLVPQGRYCRMKNVYFIPTLSTFRHWVSDAGFTDIRCISEDRTTQDEQRTTDWSAGQSLRDFLDPQNPNLSIEGYPAPRRAILIAKKP